MHFTLSELATHLRGRVHGADVTVDGATIDSRSLRPGQLFVPLVAERDGHDFIPAALEAGAPAYLTARPPLPGTAAVEVADTTVALTALGRVARDRLATLDSVVVGITGSVGKTTCKDLCAAVFATSGVTHASYRSFNNELGLPLTLATAPDDARSVILEMGARGVGHIASLCEVARPTVGMVLRVGAAHTEMFGDLEGVAKAKGEMVEALAPDAVAVLNADDPRVAAMAARTVARVLTYGVAEPADVMASEVSLDDQLRPSFTLRSPWGDAAVRLGIRGEHNVGNALAAAAAALSAGLSLDAVVAGLGADEQSPWRMELVHTPHGAVVLNDAYNANPVSMRAALAALGSLAAERRVAVLGVMAELGADSDAEHAAVGELAAAAGVEVISIGVPAYGGTVVEGWEEALTLLGDPGPGTAVLCKGSRVAGLERLVAAMVDTA